MVCLDRPYPFKLKDCFPKNLLSPLLFITHKQRSNGALRKRCSENMQQMYTKTPMSKCDFNKLAKKLKLKSHFDMGVFL